MAAGDEQPSGSPPVAPSAAPPPPSPVRAPQPAQPMPARPLAKLDVEAIRVAGERTYAALVEQHPAFERLASMLIPPDPRDVRRALMARSLRLTESMAAEAHRVAREAQRVLGVEGALELYQRTGAENAAIHLVPEPILLEIQGSLLSRLDERAMLGLFGHELGHYLAHGPTSPLRRAHAIVPALGGFDDPALHHALSRLSMMAELTADRIGLLACQDLTAMLRLEMAVVTGLAGTELTWDTDAYLAQARELIEDSLQGGGAIRGETHPEHNLRVYALWLFSETREYRELTGRGPGTRALAEVDALIARCFADDAAGAQIVLDHSRLGDPLPELHECALACAVLVAFADGELTDDEREAIERQFATLVPDWQTYLDREIALERFRETAGVLAAGGADLVASLFHVLVHVMLADGVPHPDELALIMAIGRVLGAEAAYRKRLGAVLATIRASIGLDEVAARELPLPARRKDVEDAFETFLSGVARRGETTITLRRLLRLLGSEQRTEELVARISRAFEAKSIVASPPPAEVGLDDRIVLTAPPAASVEEREVAIPASRAALVAALKRLREQLVSGDGRSPSVRLRQLRRGRAFDLVELERVSVGLAERVLEQVRARRSVRAVEAADAGRHGPAATVATDLLALAREDAQRSEETGAHDLYVGYPFVTGSVAGYVVRAPLVLYPVMLERDGDGARGFRITPRRDELPVANQSLIRLVFNKRGFAYSDELSDELEALAGAPDGGPEAVRRKLEEVGLPTAPGGGALRKFQDRDEELALRTDGLEIEDVAVLGLFPQSSSDLLQDYDGLLQHLADPRADVGALLAAASTLLPEALTSPVASAAEAEAAAAAALADWAPVIPADPSQRSVITESRKHGATVVDGPPGTGKSQVIVNLVAEALRRGERVAVVCEKRAALDVVYQRLTAIGFGKALAVVHDVHEDRKALYAHVAKRVETRERIPFDAAEAEQIRVEHAQVRHALEQRTAALRVTVPGLDLTLGELFAFVAGQPRTPLPDGLGLDQVPQARLRELLDAVVALHPLAELWGPHSPWRRAGSGRARASLAGMTPAHLSAIEAEISRALAAAQDYEALAATSPVPVERVAAARGALQLAVHSRQARTDERDRALFGTIATLAATEPDRLRAAADARRAWQEGSHALVKLEHPVALEAGSELVASLSVLKRWAGAWYRIFVMGWWKARGTLRRELSRVWPERAGAAITPALLDELADRITASRAWKAIGHVFEQLGLGHALPPTAGQLAPAIERVAVLGEALRELGAARAELTAAQAWLPSGAATPDELARWDRTIDERLALLAARDALAAAVAPVRARFPWLEELPRAGVLAQLLSDLRRDGVRLAEADTLVARASSVVTSAPALLDAVLAAWRDAPASAWKSGVTAAWGAAWLARLERESPGLAQLGQGADDREVERLAQRLRELETERRELEIERTLTRIDDTRLLNIAPAAKGARRTPEQKLREELLKETRKQRMLMPLRTFVRRFAPHGLLDVVPVWLLSPETMAILFPRQPLFDLVVFDEASQCTVEAGLPVLLRAKRVVIAGDEKQMPPSSYFTLGSDDDDEPPAAGLPDPDDTRALVKDLLGAESLLSLARPRVAHAGLTWHYRCRDESLIAFSNHAMYEGGLLTIPSTAGAAAPSAIHWVEVPDGVYNSGENPREAQRVVDVVDELLARDPRPTIGVVTFNLKQRRAILDAIDARCADDPAFRERWTAATTQGGLDERPFVKNLEQVQGDERDVIVFSLGHAPVERRRGGATTGETYVPARFGPLGQRGGERRLNVAISRAKAACYVVASFHPSQLTVASSKHQGPRLFKHFLEFAHHLHHGRKLEAARVLDLVRASGPTDTASRARRALDGFVPVQTQLALALEAAGIPYEPDVGASGFQVPIAILDPADPTRYALAILIDSPSNDGRAALPQGVRRSIDDARGGADPFEHHVHRPGVLRQRGWNVLSISTASWLRRSAEILDEIAALVPGCRGAVQSEVYVRHREQLQRAQGPTGVTNPTVARRATSNAGPEIVHVAPLVPDSPPAPAPAAEPEPEPPASGPVAADSTPAWALAIADELFRKALLHIEEHGALDEAELTSLVGGPRRARLFSRSLDAWRASLPFHIEIAEVSGVKIYRRAGAG